MDQGFIVDGDILISFVTPVMVRKWPNSDDLNKRLRDAILETERREPGLSRSNVGGWHSKDDLFRWKTPAVGELLERVMTATKEMTAKVCGEAVRGSAPEVAVSGWANVSRNGHYNAVHNHIRYTWSGVYYVTLGENDTASQNSGVIEFLDPRLGIDPDALPGNTFKPHLRVYPEAGTMLMFPAWLQHWVHPFHGESERISIAFNVKLRF